MKTYKYTTSRYHTRNMTKWGLFVTNWVDVKTYAAMRSLTLPSHLLYPSRPLTPHEQGEGRNFIDTNPRTKPIDPRMWNLCTKYWVHSTRDPRLLKACRRAFFGNHAPQYSVVWEAEIPDGQPTRDEVGKIGSVTLTTTRRVDPSSIPTVTKAQWRRVILTAALQLPEFSIPDDQKILSYLISRKRWSSNVPPQKSVRNRRDVPFSIKQLNYKVKNLTSSNLVDTLKWMSLRHNLTSDTFIRATNEVLGPHYPRYLP